MDLSDKVSKMINEELSISFEVEKMSNKIKNAIINDLKNALSLEDKKLKYKENTISYSIFNNIYDIKYKIYTNINPLSDKLYGCTYLDDYELDLNLCMTGGIPYAAKFDSIIYHEILHIYQYSLNKKNYLTNTAYAKIYNKVKEVMKSSTNDSDLIIANAIYVSFEFEQDAMMHGLYGVLKKYRKENLYDAFLHSEEYSFLNDMHTLIEHEDEADFSLYDLEKEKTMKLIKKEYSRYMTKLTHMYQKVYNEKRFTGI